MKYSNPVIRGFNPDPSICQVDSDYYLVTSTFEYFPGIPVYHSRDLVNWKIVGHCITRVEQLPLNTVKASGGIWAPTIRYHQGVFYVTATFSELGNFIIQTNKPGGEWSDPVWVDMPGIDPSLFFEEGLAYYCTNGILSDGDGELGTCISLSVIDPATGQLIGIPKRIWEGSGGGFLEAPHIYHIGNWYFLLAAEGGTERCHMATVARSKHLWGPYIGNPDNPLLTNRHDMTKQILCSGHAELTADHEGNWWLIHLGTRPSVGIMSTLGRETFLTPVTWQDEWPVVLPDRMARIDVETTGVAIQQTKKVWELDLSSKDWEKELLFIKELQPEKYRRKKSFILLYPGNVPITSEDGTPTMLLVRPLDINFKAWASFNFETYEDSDEAGMVLYLTPRFNYRICKRRKNDHNWIIIEKIVDDFYELIYEEKVASGTLNFGIALAGTRYEFFYSQDDCKAKRIGTASARFLCCEIVNRSFTGTLIGVYAQAARETKAAMEIYNFSQKVSDKFVSPE